MRIKKENIDLFKVDVYRLARIKGYDTSRMNGANGMRQFFNKFESEIEEQFEKANQNDFDYEGINSPT
jgi:hypothetical protein